MRLKVEFTANVLYASSSRSSRSVLRGGDFSLTITDDRPGLLVFEVPTEGSDLFEDEAGGHRWQQISDDRKIHTSTVTVAVLPEPTETELHLDPRDLHVIATRGTGPGGQARNTTDSCIQVTHKPSGVQVRCDTERSQHQNRASAIALLRARLWEREQERQSGDRASARRAMVGTGQRGDKSFTLRYKDNIVTKHRTGEKMALDRYLRGFCFGE